MKKGFVFIETIIVITILTVGLMSIYANYSKILSNTKESNTFDTAEYNYKTYFLKQMYKSEKLISEGGTVLKPSSIISQKNKCYMVATVFSEDSKVKVCLLNGVFNTTGYESFENIDAYIIDYINNNDIIDNNDNLFLVEYKKQDKQNPDEYFTYISSLNY